jgi:hypothetical protein
MLDKHNLARPNQGIWRSAWNSIRVGLVGGLIVGLIGWIFGSFYKPFFGLVGELVRGLFGSIGLLTIRQFDGLAFGLVGSMLGGLIFGQLNGGDECIKHIVLRLLLWSSNWAPLNYPHFLDYAAERLLLRKVGGGYIFIHRLLLDYFASLDSTPAVHNASEPS